MRTSLRLAKNAVANLVRGGVAGIIAIFLPAVLVRHMSQIEYAVWVLVLQIAAYCSYLDFGLQTAVGRYTAVADENKDPQLRDAVFSTAFTGLVCASVLAIAALVIISFAAGSLFPTIPPEWLHPMRAAILIVGTSLALGLPSSAWSGIFIGMQRNELIAAVVGGFRLISASVLVLAAIHHASLTLMACLVGSVNLASYLVLYLLSRRFTEVRFRPELVGRSVAKDLINYCFSLTIWSFSMLLVSGVDLILVGRFEVDALVPYSLAASLTSFMAGVQTAVFTAMMAHAAVLHARRDPIGLGSMVVRTTQLAVGLLIVTGLPILAYAIPLFRVWVGGQYSTQGHRFLVVLMAANIIRLLGNPYSVVLVASGQQKLVVLSPISEGVTNFLASLLLGARFGAIGVAFGTLIGGTVGLIGHIFYNMPRTTREITFSRKAFLGSALALPFLASAPLILFCIWTYSRPEFTAYSFSAATALTLACLGGILAYGQNRARKQLPLTD